MPGDDFDEVFGDDFDDEHGSGLEGGEDPLPEGESLQVARDLEDLDAFERVFGAEGAKGVSMWCHDCDEEHFYRWDLLRSSLEVLLETGEIPVHEPAFRPDPHDYVPWEYARGYVDALRDVGGDERLPVDTCPGCDLRLEGMLQTANWCPRCAVPLLGARLAVALDEAGLAPAVVERVLRDVGMPHGR